MRSTAFLITLASILIALDTGYINVVLEVGLVISFILFVWSIWLVKTSEKN